MFEIFCKFFFFQRVYQKTSTTIILICKIKLSDEFKGVRQRENEKEKKKIHAHWRKK